MRDVRLNARKLVPPLVALLAAVSLPSEALAQAEDPSKAKESAKEAKPKSPPKPPANPRAETPKLRYPKDYDGREEPTTAGDVLIWIPRVVFFPAYVVTEYVIRRPLGAATAAAERGRWVQEIKDFFTWGPTNNIGIYPTALIDFGFRSSVGAYFFYDDLGVKGNHLRVHGATGGYDWWRLTIADRVDLDERSYVKIRGEGWIRPDWAFFGVGPESLEQDRSRYVAKTLEGGASFFGGLDAPSAIDFYASVKHIRFGEDTCCGDPTLHEKVRQGVLEPPPFLDSGYTAQRLGLKLALDSRRPRPSAGSGARADLAVEHSFNLEDARSRWIRYGATATGFVDITGHNRVLSLSLAALFADPLGERDLPFTELVSLGGNNAPMRGYLQDRLLGRSAAVATLEYRYPIWAFFDGSIQVAAGNVFGEHLAGLDPELLRMSFTAGIRTSEERDYSFDLLVGSGTETFKQGAGIHDVRIVFGATQGF
jgi:hypothetical protein